MRASNEVASYFQGLLHRDGAIAFEGLPFVPCHDHDQAVIEVAHHHLQAGGHAEVIREYVHTFLYIR
ncbi:hypothetical protein CJU23_27005 [Pseudomonas aeruginosa]|nr:hypothetical protein CJU23_27005 [Pseudomonas aeruginosa]